MTLLEGSYDVFMYEESPGLSFDNVFSNLLDHAHALCLCSLPFPSLEFCIEKRINSHVMCGSHLDMGYEDNVFHVLGRSVDDQLSLGCV